jgi:aminoglycoside phosphotransferase (APT) family kinase protein
MLISTSRIDPAAVDLASYPVLGTGIWGSVVDLGNGTVVKLARRTCAGIGDGLDKMCREHAVLQALPDRSPCGGIAFPRALGFGAERPGAYPLWLHTSKLPGRVWKLVEIRNLPEETASALALTIGEAASMTQKVLAEAGLAHQLPTIEEYVTSVESSLTGDDRAIGYLSQLLSISRTLPAAKSCVVHGDFNISNLLFDGERVIGVIDFAETRIGYPEDDLAAIVGELPSLRSAVVESFEAASGWKVETSRLDFASAMQALFTFVICDRLDERAERDAARGRLDSYLAQAS